MTVRISLSTVLVALVFAAIGAGGAVGVIVWEPWDDSGDKRDETAALAPSPQAEKEFSITVETAADLENAAQQLAALMPDFACTGEWNEIRDSGIIDCGAGLTGFKCRNLAHTNSSCREKEHLAPEFPQCSVEGTTRSGYLIKCTGPNTNAACEVRRTELTCQRA